MTQREKEIEGRISGQAQGWRGATGTSELHFRREESGRVAWTAQANRASRYQCVEFASEFYGIETCSSHLLIPTRIWSSN